MKYVFIEKHQAEFSIKAMCRVLRVARSGWYVWRNRRCQITPRQQFRLVCDEAVRNAFAEAKQRYGAPRLADELPEYNIKTIAASLCRQGLRAKASRKFSPVSYPPDIRKAIYTTNAIEPLNSVIRAAIKKRKVFPTDDSVRKVSYLAIKDASKKWSMPIQNWRLAMSRFIIEFGDRLSDHL